jgi:pyrroline-5-carboxylate reductase
MAKSSMTALAKWGFIGGGNMAEAIIKGMISGGTAPAAIIVAEPLETRRRHLTEKYAVTTTTDSAGWADSCSTIVLAVKPQMAADVCAVLKGQISGNQLLISIMAGITCKSIEGYFAGAVRVVRVMPNTPALVLAGAAAITGGSYATVDDLAATEALFAQIGCSCRLDEKLMDAVTGLSGSGPAYVLTFIEALADGGVKQGLPRDAALQLAVQTVLGTAKLLAETGEHPGSLRDKVTSPGGTTIAGLHALEKGSFRATVMNAVEAATLRSKELGK